MEYTHFLVSIEDWKKLNEHHDRQYIISVVQGSRKICLDEFYIREKAREYAGSFGDDPDEKPFLLTSIGYQQCARDILKGFKH